MPTLTTQDPGLVKLVEDFGTPETFGVPPDAPLALRVKIGKAILTVAAADGELSPRERARFNALAAQYGAPLDAFGGFDPVNADLDDFLDHETRPAAKVILHDAIRVARADGYGPKERVAARRGAALLGISEETVRAIEGILEMEEALNRARASVVAPN